MAECNGKHNDEAFITLATNDVYSRGALVLAESLKKYGTSRKLVIMITPHVTPSARAALDDVFDDVRLVDVLDSRDAAHLALLKRPELGITFTKIHCWTLTEYKKCVFMDADMMALQNIDELFEREELSASPDSGWPDIFNSGLFVFRPSLETFNGLLLLAQNEGSFDGGDQGLLNTYFKDWATKDISRHLPFLYNLHVSASYTYLPAFKRFGKDTKVVHFLGPVKPWHHVYNRVTGGVQQIAGPMQSGTQHLPQYLSEWWALYNDRVQKYFSKEQEMRDHVCMESHETIKEQNYQQTAEEDTQTHEHRQEQHQDSSIAEDSPPCDDEHPSYTSPPRPRSPSPPPNPYHWSPPATFYREQPSYTKEPPPLPKPEPPPSPKPESSPPPKPESSPHPKSEPLSPPKPEPSRILKTEPPQSPIHEQPRPATPPRESQPEILSPRTPPRDKTSPPPSEPHRTPEEHPPTRSETSTTSNQKVDTSNRRTKRKHKTVLPDSQYYDLYMYSRPFQFASLTRSLNKESSSSQDRKHKRTPPRENAIKTRMVSCIRGANFWC